MNFKTLKFSQDEFGVGLLTLSRPQALNALNAELIKEFAEVLGLIENNKELRCLVVTGEGEKSFVAGADIKEMIGLGPEQASELSRLGQEAFDRLESLAIPTIACVNGFALGGGMELALACDFIIASEKAKFGLPEVGLGLIPGYGGTQRLARSLGVHRAKMLTFTGDIYKAEQIYQWGLISLIVPSEALMDETMKVATGIASRAPIALNHAKQAINSMRDSNLKEGLLFERKKFSELFTTEDVAVGVSAFVEKRKPVFSGR